MTIAGALGRRAADPPDQGSPWTPAIVAAHGIVGAAVAYVAFFRLAVPDAAPDEYTYRTCADAYVHASFACNLEHPPLAKELLGIGVGIFGDSIGVARATTAVAAIATALFCYLFCRDVAGRAAGLVAAGAWGLLPQAGVEGQATLEAVRIDRFALLDPYVACFVALALFAGWRFCSRGGARLAALAGAACAAAACAKAPGALIAPVVLVVPFVIRRRDPAIRREAAAALGGVVAMAVAIYAPLGPSGAGHEIRQMFSFQLNHATREVVVAGHFYVTAPWWADLSFALAGTGAIVAVTLLVAAAAGALSYRVPALYALGASASVVIGTGIGLHLSQPHYWIDWEPGVIDAAALGIAGAFRHLATRPLALGGLGLLAWAAVATVHATAGVGPGPYEDAAPALRCDGCTIAYAGYLDVLLNYLPASEQAVPGPPASVDGHVVVKERVDGKRLLRLPEAVVIDPVALELHGSWREDVRIFEADATHFGFRRVPVAGRLLVYEKVG